MIMVTPLFSERSVFQISSVPAHKNEMLAFYNSTGLKSVFGGKLRFGDGFKHKQVYNRSLNKVR